MPALPTPPSMKILRTTPRGDSLNPATEYSALLHTVRDAGLLRRRTGFYYLVFASLTIALGGAAFGAFELRHSWLVLLFGAALGVVLTQFAFLAHESSHRQVFESGRANDMAGRTLANLFVGISYSWWMTKHSRHHANPNVRGKDADIAQDFVSFLEEDAAATSGLHAWLTKRQGYLFSQSSSSMA